MVDSSEKKGGEKPPLNSRHTVNVNESNGPQYHKIPFKGKRKKNKEKNAHSRVYSKLHSFLHLQKQKINTTCKTKIFYWIFLEVTL